MGRKAYSDNQQPDLRALFKAAYAAEERAAKLIDGSRPQEDELRLLKRAAYHAEQVDDLVGAERLLGRLVEAERSALTQGRLAYANHLAKPKVPPSEYDVLKRFLIRSPPVRPSREALASTLEDLGDFFNRTGRADAAQPVWQEAAALRREQIADGGDDDPADQYEKLATLYDSLKQMNDAEASLFAAKALREAKLKTAPTASASAELLETLDSLAHYHRRSGTLERALKVATTNVSLARVFVRHHPNIDKLKESLAEALFTLAQIQLESGSAGSTAERTAAEGVWLIDSLATANPDRADFILQRDVTADIIDALFKARAAGVFARAKAMRERKN